MGSKSELFHLQIFFNMIYFSMTTFCISCLTTKLVLASRSLPPEKSTKSGTAESSGRAACGEPNIQSCAWLLLCVESGVLGGAGA